MNQSHLDHITITTPTLEAGAKFVEKTLGVTPQMGGEHPKMGTHNLFLRLGDSTFLEVIACDPHAKKPDRPRWFALDKINKDTLPQLKTWVVRTENIHSISESSSEPLGEVELMSRGENNWLMTIPKDGSIPFNEGAPALIQWQMKEHPAQKLKDFGLSLSNFQIYHPEPEKLINLLSSINLKEEVEVLYGAETKLSAYIDTPDGVRVINV
jgi:catechol 2,3-dioxygenase-like lactoylglutathione lyase family enzyme